MRRFTLAPERVEGARVAFDAEESRHLARVLRLRPGETVLAIDGTGREYTVRLESMGEHATGTILGVAAGATESPLAITLVQGVPKGDKMEAIVRAATELGVMRVCPAVTERTVVRLEPGRWRERARRWQRVAREAAKQSRRTRVPDVDPPRPIADCLAATAGELALCLWEGAAPPLAAVFAAVEARPRTAVVLVGPEGGLAGHEVQAAVAAGYQTASLGARILRTETAGPVIVALLQARYGDLGVAGAG